MSEHFQPKEFASRTAALPLILSSSGGLYQLLEEIRDEFGKPIVVNSGYRSPEHNKNIGGAKTPTMLRNGSRY
ncbi:MAG: D-Ala-D-Ala carboxypeptidase family metallohydrolase [Parasutterella sp.]